MVTRLALFIPPIRRLWEERNRLAQTVEQTQDRNSPFWHYQSSFDPQEVIRRYAGLARPLATEGVATNFLGVHIDPDVFPMALESQRGSVEPIPIPANWHADIAEWGAALRAVDLASGRFRVMELGCGWGCWLVNTGAAARSRGLSVQIIGVEGDLEHVAMAHRTMAANGFSSNYFIHHAVAAGRRGKALFPIVEHASNTWGSKPVFDATDEQVADAVASGKFHILDALPVSDMRGGEPLDLLHIDIQGGEAALLRDCLEDLNEGVRYLVVGTHSRMIEGSIIETMSGAGWILEIERPCIFTIGQDGRQTIVVDGVQGWRNTRL